MQPTYPGTFAQHPISVTLIIFLNMLEEETSWKRSAWNLSIKRTLCCFLKKNHFLCNCLKKMPGFLTYTRQRVNVRHKFDYLKVKIKMRGDACVL